MAALLLRWRRRSSSARQVPPRTLRGSRAPSDRTAQRCTAAPDQTAAFSRFPGPSAAWPVSLLRPGGSHLERKPLVRGDDVGEDGAGAGLLLAHGGVVLGGVVV